jgi:hypothetical protein
LINATNKLLVCYAITRESVGNEAYLHFYRGLRSDNASDKELAFRELENLRKLPQRDERSSRQH